MIVLKALMVFVGLQLCIDCRTQKTGILLLSYFWVYLMCQRVAFMILMMIKRHGGAHGRGSARTAGPHTTDGESALPPDRSFL